jgi:hypothetical protein
VVCICAVCLVWVLFWFAAWLDSELEAEVDAPAREYQLDSDGLYRVVRDDREQIRTFARIDAAMAELDALGVTAKDAPDEHVAGFV